MYILKQPFLIGKVYLKIIKEGVKMVSQCEHSVFVIEPAKQKI